MCSEIILPNEVSPAQVMDYVAVGILCYFVVYYNVIVKPQSSDSKYPLPHLNWN